MARRRRRRSPVSPATIAQKGQSGLGAPSGDNRQGAGLDAEHELGVVADVVAVDLHGERAQRAARRMGDRGDSRASVTPSKWSIWRWLVIDSPLVNARAATLGTSRWAARRSIAIDSVPPSRVAPSQMRRGRGPKYE